jgi:hypothetical protein
MEENHPKTMLKHRPLKREIKEKSNVYELSEMYCREGTGDILSTDTQN